MNKNFYCVIMAGGVGSRFWPVSRNHKPKQFLDILGVGRTFLQLTYDRFTQIVPQENILVVTAENYRDLVCEQLPELPKENILLEPYKRNTAPCIAYAATKIKARNPQATMVVAPSDHIIFNEQLFVNTILSALNYAVGRDELFTLGIDPTRPETGYGYIQSNMASQYNIDGIVAYQVKTFTEKPDKELAQVFIDSGEFLWNSGIFIWSADAICSALEEYLPEVYLPFKEGYKYYYTSEEQSFIDNLYAGCPSISIDYGVMEKATNVIVFQVSFGWTDLGTWGALYLLAEKDSENNYVRVSEKIIDTTTNSILFSTENEKLMVVKGLDNYMVVNTEDVLMICPRTEGKFKEVMADLAANEKSKFM
ncbi:MAG: mannose-1-phosphate guanylyltransferase [Bacteroidales bacterium]|jgi:mannose-1-phosphate guanylyltransferase|nr:mannose-1-phosphate guanylyltransferase [Bacteroidales bacterium]MBQ5881255.1 mannose-1-phosphate guanylyltransferase [Bacteroidales bacterium]